MQDSGAPIASSAKRRGENNWKWGTEGDKVLRLNKILVVKPAEMGRILYQGILANTSYPK